MQWSERRNGDVAILDLKGKLTIGVGDVQLRGLVRDLIDRGETRIVVNMKDVSYMDSAGTGELVYAYTSAKNAGAELKLLNLGARPRELLQFTELIRVFESFDDEDAAVASFGDS